MIDRTYDSWVQAAEQRMTPLVARMQSGAAFLRLEGMASNHGVGAEVLDPSDDDVDQFVGLQAVAEWASSGSIAHSGADRTRFLADSSHLSVLKTDGGEGVLVCFPYGGKQPSNDWKVLSADAAGVVLEKENEPLWEIRFE